MNKLLALTLCCLLFATTNAAYSRDDDSDEGSPAPFTIDTASNILQDLANEAQQNLDDLEANWAVNEPILQANIDAIQNQLDNKQAECAGLDDVLAGHTAELDNAVKYVAWLVKRIQENQDKIVDILAERCAQNNQHVESIKNDKIALSLVEFLREQLSNYDSEAAFLAKRKMFMKHLTSFLAVYRRGNLSELIQLKKQIAADYEVDVNTDVRARSDDEIGVGHVDNNVGDLELEDLGSDGSKSWEFVLGDLLNLLQEIEDTINAKIATSLEDEVRASVAAADFKLKLEHEIQVYQQELEKWTANVARLEAVVAQDTANVAQCRAEEAAIEEQLATAQNDLQVATEQYNHKHANLSEEIEIFQEVIELYNDEVANQDNDFKARADDWIDDGDFDDESYDDREVPDIDFLNQ